MMDFRDLFLIEHARVHAARTASPDLSVQDSVLRDVSEDQIRARPQAGFNSMAWLFWHITRTEDIGVNVIICGQPQVFDTGNWPTKMNVERRDLGGGMTDDEVDALDRSIDVAAMFEYRDAVGRQTQAIVGALGSEVLDQRIGDADIQRIQDEHGLGPNAQWVPDRWNGKLKSFTLSHTVLGHSLLHLGQAEINRSLFGLPTL